MSRTGSVSSVISAETIAPAGDSTTARAAVEELAAVLSHGGIPDPRRTAADILAALLDLPRTWATANPGAEVSADARGAARAAARRLCAGAPFAYAVGSAPFRHLTLSVDDRVLIPRPETEMLVGEVLDRMNARGDTRWGIAADIGTGSGAIALSLATEGKFERVIATDASVDALAVATGNRDRLGPSLRCPVEMRAGSLLAPLGADRASVIVSNPPYLASSEIDSLPASVRDWEPPFALLSGPDGMAATTAILRDAARYLVPGGLLAIELDERRASLAAEQAMRHGSYTNVTVGLDLAGRERFLFCDIRTTVRGNDA
jgi:release factor glutamine methyltransferase